MFLALLTYIRPLDEIDAHIPSHAQYLADLYAEGRMHLSGRRHPRTGGFMLFTAADRPQAENLLARDPFHALGLARYELIELQPTQAAPSLRPLLGS